MRINKMKDVAIGDMFIQKSKHRKDICEVIDKLTTTNSNGEIVNVRWLCQHDFMGQKIKHEECDSTVRRNRI